MNLIKGVASVFLTVFFAVTILFATMIGIINDVITQENLINKINNNDAYKEISKIASNITQTYLKDNSNKIIYEEFVQEENIEELVKSLVSYIYTDENFAINEKSFEAVLKANINDILQKNNIQISEEEKNDIDIFVNNLTEEFNIKEFVPENQNSQIINGIPIIIRMLKNAFKTLVVAIIILFIITLVINSNNIFNGIKFLASGLVVTGGLLLVWRNIFNNVAIDIFTKSTSDSLAIISIFQDIFNGAIQLIKNCGMLYITLGIAIGIVAILIEYLRKSNKKGKVL